MLNVYKIPGKEHRVVEIWDTDEIAALKIPIWKYLEYVPPI